jgi:hypothetical protein
MFCSLLEERHMARVQHVEAAAYEYLFIHIVNKDQVSLCKTGVFGFRYSVIGIRSKFTEY